MNYSKLLKIAAAATALLASGCATTNTIVGGGTSTVTGASSVNSRSADATQQLTKCATPIGTAALIESKNDNLAQMGLTSPVPLIRLMMSQSGCFQVVDRGAASEALRAERALAAEGHLEAGSRMGGGQLKAADFLITPSIIFQDSNAGGGMGGLGAFLPGYAGLIAGAINIKKLEAQTMLSVTNVRTGVQVVIAEGRAKKSDIGFGGFGYGGVLGGGGAYQSTDLGKIVTAAFLDAHNKAVAQLQATR